MNIKDFTKGWLVGNFSPCLFNNTDVEIGVKYYKKGDKDENHYHKIATEYTIVISGEVRMLNKIFTSGDIIIIEPNIENQFDCLQDACILVIKTPSVIGDKYQLKDFL